MKKKKVLLFGASGFLGSKILEFASDDIELSVSYREQKIESRKKQIKIDLLDFDSLSYGISSIKPQVIIHAARIHPFDDNPKEAKTATEKLVKAVSSAGAKLIYISSDAVFDGKKGDYLENDRTNPVTNYGKAKVEAENVIRSKLSDYIIIRPSYIYDDKLNKLDRREFQVLSQIKNGEAVFRFKDMYRSPTLVTDLAKVIWKLVDNNFVGVVHIAGRKQSVYGFYKDLAKTLGYDDNLIKPDLIDSNHNAQDCSLNTELADRILNYPI